MTDYKAKHNLSSDNPIYKDILKITDEEAIAHSPWAKGMGRKTLYKIKKEILSERLMKSEGMWEALFSKGAPRPATLKSTQKSGVDYCIYSNDDGRNVLVDLKASVGNYEKDMMQQLAIEYKQNGVISFDETKKTDYVVYVYADTAHLALYFIKAPINIFIQLVKNVSTTDCEKSDNGSGEFFRYPIEDLKKLGCTVIQRFYPISY